MMLPDSLLRDVEILQRKVSELEAREQVSWYLPWVARSVVSPYSAAGTSTVYDTGSAAKVKVIAYGFMAFVLTTNTAINYWEMGIIGTTMLSTAAIAPNVWTYVSGAVPFTEMGVGTARIVASINVTKVGAPGSLYLVPQLLVTTQ